MKRILVNLLVVVIAAVSFTMSAGDKFDYVYLNNGDVVKGVVESNENGKVAIRDTKGNLLTFSNVAVNKVIYGKDPVLPSSKAGNSASSYNDYSTFNRGFWWAADLSGGVSLIQHTRNISFVELDVVAGYRFNQFLRVGAGIGVRDYLGRKSTIRFRDNHFAFPLFATVRGNIIVNDYRSVVPYWSLDCGATIQDGFMIRPTIGMRIGTETRHSFIVGLSYLNQRVLSDRVDSKDTYRNVSFLSLRLGYEF